MWLLAGVLRVVVFGIFSFFWAECGGVRAFLVRPASSCRLVVVVLFGIFGVGLFLRRFALVGFSLLLFFLDLWFGVVIL